MKFEDLQKQLQAILFAAGEPVERSRLAQGLGVDEDTVDKVVLAVGDVLDKYTPLEILKLESRYQLCTKADYASCIRTVMESKRNTPLSQAAMEVLAIIAYNQPVTKAFVEQVRGVDSSGVVSSLLEKGLVEEAGRLELPGRPISYATTAVFLRCFGLEGLEKLPSIPANTAELPPIGEESIT